LAVVLLLGIVGLSFSGGGAAQAGEPVTAAGTPVAVGTGEGPSLEFEPKSVTAPANAPVALTFTNHSTLPHNLSFEGEISAKTADIGEGVSETINFTTPAPGSYKFVCTIHPGMEGELAVQ
jgi:plastocyanin